MVKVYYCFEDYLGNPSEIPKGKHPELVVLKKDFDRAISLLRLYHEGHSPEEQAEVSRETEEFLEECK